MPSSRIAALGTGTVIALLVALGAAALVFRRGDDLPAEGNQNAYIRKWIAKAATASTTPTIRAIVLFRR